MAGFARIHARQWSFPEHPLSSGESKRNLAKQTAVRLRTGATVRDGGVNFSLFSRTASGAELLLFEHEEDAKPTRISLNPIRNRTCHYWRTFVPGVKSGQIYAYCVHHDGFSFSDLVSYNQNTTRPTVRATAMQDDSTRMH